ERGLSEPVIARMKPWVAMLAVASSGAQDASLTLDSRLLSAARHARLRVEALESIEEQVAAFDAIPLASQIALLRHALEHRAALEAENETMTQAWLEGDLAALAHFPSRMDSENPGVARHYNELMRHVIHDRTVLMHFRLATPLRTGRAFVAIGALHLQGEKGLLALLERDGFRPTRIA
ncbi:MAG: TraB/GumN family protein, partial [Burkholderiales bacterium]